MAPLTTAAGLVLTFIASAPSASINAFAPVAPSLRHVTSTPSWCSSPSPILRMSEGENADADSATAEADSVETEEPKLDPEIVALKESIASFESDLKSKRTQLSGLEDMVDKYSSAGYARQVATMENNKRMRGANNSESKDAARALVMRSFLPALDELDAVGARYEGVEFARTFDAGLRKEFNNALDELGVSEYAVASGVSMDVGRVVAIEEEPSEEFAKGTVIRALKSGLEISGNIVRPAEVVASSGSAEAGEGFGGK